MNLKKIIRVIILSILLLLIIPSYIILNRVKNDYPLREYVKETFLSELKNDFTRFFTYSEKGKVLTNTLNIEISDVSLKNIEGQIKQRLESLASGDANLLSTNKWDYINAIAYYNTDTLNVKMRIRGDMPSNYNRSFEKATFRLNIRDGKTLNGKKKLSIITPEMESGFYGFLFYKIFNEEGFLSNDIEIIRLKINGKDVGVRYLQEGFSKELVESSNRREGPILRFKNDCVDNLDRYNEHLFPEMISYKETRNLKTSSLSKTYARAINKYDELIRGNVSVSNCFNIDEYAKFYALNDIFLSHHANKCQNIKLYFNPINDKFEPIAWDPNNYQRYKVKLPILKGHTQRYGEICDDQRLYPIHFLLAQDDFFLKKYAVYLWNYVQDDTILKMIGQYDDIIKNTEPELFRQNFQEDFKVEKIVRNINEIKDDFNQDQHLSGNYFVDEKKLSIRSLCNLPLVIDSISYKGTKIVSHTIISPNKNVDIRIPIDSIRAGKAKLKVYSRILGMNKTVKYKAKIFQQKDDFSTTIFKESFNSSYFLIDSIAMTFKLREKHLLLTEDLFITNFGMTWVIEPGTKIELQEANIICESPVKALGSFNNPIIFKSNFSGGVLLKNATSPSIFKNVNFIGLSNPQESNWSLTGAVTFYKSEIILDSCLFSNNISEDALNIVSSEFKISNIRIENCTSDALDIDFGIGSINGIVINSCENDALDFSGSRINIEDVLLTNVGDKAISAGEKTDLSGKNINIASAFIGVASKDKSLIQFSDVKISDASYSFVAYQKKAHFGKADIVIESLSSTSSLSLIEEYCTLTINGKLIKGNKKDIYNRLYTPK